MFRASGRFWSKVRRASLDECWTWTAATNDGGYGRLLVTFPGGRRRVLLAHRFAYALAHGPIPDGLIVCHACDNPPCVNPLHLFVGTHADNAAGRGRKGRHSRGERHPVAVLTEAEAREIIRASAAGAGRAALGRRFGVSAATVSGIVKGRRWAHLDRGSL